MESRAQPAYSLNPEEYVLASIHPASAGSLLCIAVVLRVRMDPKQSPFIVLREVPGSMVLLGAICDADFRIQEFVEIWIQNFDNCDLNFSNLQERLTNHDLDRRWSAEFAAALRDFPGAQILTGMEGCGQNPVVIFEAEKSASKGILPAVLSKWQLCDDNALLQSAGLPPYSQSPFRYLHLPGADSPAFIATLPDCPLAPSVKSAEALQDPGALAIFNPQAGRIRIVRLSPIEFEDTLRILEGEEWGGIIADKALRPWGIYSELRTWSARQRGVPFLIHNSENRAERSCETLLLKLGLLLNALRGIHDYTRALQLPLLNLAPSSFKVEVPDTGEVFPRLWAARCRLVKPGQAHALKIKATEQRYFLRLGRIEPSPYMPENLGAHSFGIGNVRLRNVSETSDGAVLEGTLIAEDYLRPDPQDLLWFKLPLLEERLEFYAHIFTLEAVGPREARFRTVPARLSEAIVSLLKKTMAFAKAPYEIWPMLSSPCDLYSFGIISLRALLANSRTSLPAVADDMLGLARKLGKNPRKLGELRGGLKAILNDDANLKAVASPAHLLESEPPPNETWSGVPEGIWLDTLGWLLRLFPGAGAQSYCKSFGDVSPLALESIYVQPMEDLERLCLRLRSILVPTVDANEELAELLREEIARL